MIIWTKLAPPFLRDGIIRRENIFQKLQKAIDYKLVLMTAPAGFGKTTAAASFLLNARIPYAWFSIDEEDNDPVRFWRYIVAALSGIMNYPYSLEDIPINKDIISSGMLAGIIIDRLYSIPGNLFIVLDDYHLIHDNLIQSSMAYFIKYLPANITVFILSRAEYDNNFIDSSYVRGQVLKIGIDDLSFSNDEIEEFFRQRQLAIKPEETHLLQSYTEGWAAGLVVAALSISPKHNFQNLTHYPAYNYHIERFIRDEVFDKWPDEIKDFLVYTSFLDKMCGPLCCAVTENNNASEVLKNLSEGNSLIFHMDGEGQWFRYHHLFREFLGIKLNMKSSGFIRDLHRRAGVWYRENGLSREAIISFIKAEEYSEAFILLVDRHIYLEMANSGELNEWCKLMYSISDKFPEGYLKQKIQTCCAFTLALSMENRQEEASIWLDKAQAYFEQLGNDDENEKQYLKAHIAMAMATISIVKMDIEKTLYYFEEANHLELYQPILLGELNVGEHSMLNTVYGFNGRLNKIDTTYNNLSGDIQRVIGDFSAYLSVILAEYNYERNNTEKAYQIITQGMESIIELKSPGVIVPCFITIARIKRSCGDLQGAISIVNTGRNKLDSKSKAFWNYYFNVFTADLFIDLQNSTSAEEWIDTIHISIYDKLSCLREYEYIVFSRYLILKKQYGDAIMLLKRLEVFTENQNRLKSLIQILSLLAISYNLSGNSVNAMKTFDKALELGMEHGYIRTYVDELEPMAELLSDYRNQKKKAGDNEKYKYSKMLFGLTNNYISIFRKNNALYNKNNIVDNVMAELLSPREYKVLKLLAAERTNSEIADELCITIRTVKQHNSRIFEKLGVKNRLEAIIMARESGMLN